MIEQGKFANHLQTIAMKYLWRWQKKNGVEDLRKAQRCLQFLIDLQTEDKA
jgi:hypothetical protein